MYRLLAPLNYFRIINREKQILDMAPTMVGAIVLTMIFTLIPSASFFRVEGFIDRLLTLTSCLTGFYVAALLAAATFSQPDLDTTIKYGPIKMRRKDVLGNRIIVSLTRRQFVCTIFGYLAFSSLVLSAAFSLAIAISKTNWRVLHANLLEWKYVAPLFDHSGILYLRAFAIFIFSLAISHLIVASSLGLYYLMDRLYKTDSKMVSQKTDNERAA